MPNFFDEVAIPALVRAQGDSDDGTLSPERRLMFKDGIGEMLEDLSDDAAADASSASDHLPPPAIEKAPGIVCVAGRNELDEAAASSLVHLLCSKHFAAETLASDRSQSSLDHATVICLSLISTSSPARARYLVRRLRRRAPRAKVLVGLWRLDPDELAAAITTIARPDTVVATSLREAVASLESDLSTPAGYTIRATGVG